jgi:hypothetical protein
MNRRLNSLIFLILLLTGCYLPRANATPTSIPYQNCYFNWDTQSLPDLSTTVQSAMEATGLKEMTVSAEAYGEDCIDAQTNKVVSFSAMETDYRIQMTVDNLTDRERLGSLLEQILVVLDGFPTGTTPGPQPGYIGISFQAGTEELNLWFLKQDGESARAEGLHGAALLDKFTNK